MPAQCEGTCRRYDVTPGAPTAISAGQVGEHAGRERITVCRQPEVRLGSARHQVPSSGLSLTPQREVHVPAVAHARHRDLRRERRAEAVPSADRVDDRAHEHGRVGRSHGILRRDRELELAGRVLRVELLDNDPRVRQRDQQVSGVVGGVDQPRHPVRRPARGRPEVVIRVVTEVVADHPLELDRGQHADALLRQGADEGGQQQPAALVVRRAVLLVAVGRSPRPPGLGAERDHAAYVGHHPQVTDRLASFAGAGDPVVEAEPVERDRRPHAPGRQVRQAIQRHRLDPGDPRVVDERRGDAHHAAFGEWPEQRGGSNRPRVAFGLVDVGDVLHTRIVGSPHRVDSRARTREGDPVASTSQEQTGLRRGLSIWQAVGISVALMAPSMAANINPQGTAGLVGRATPLAFFLAAVAVLLIAYVFVRLCQYYQHAGSVYVFAGATLGPRAGATAGLSLLGTYTFYALVTASADGRLRGAVPRRHRCLDRPAELGRLRRRRPGAGARALAGDRPRPQSHQHAPRDRGR